MIDITKILPNRIIASIAILLIAIAIISISVANSNSFMRLFGISTSDYNSYYRLKLAITNENDVPIGIDIVVGCSTNYDKTIGGGSSLNISKMDSAFYAWIIPGGHALSVRTSPEVGATDTCTGGTTKNGRIPANWLPFVIWYESANDLSHGFAYATQDAYQSTSARIAFQGATIEHATAKDYAESKTKNPSNLLPSRLSDVKLKFSDLLDSSIQRTPNAFFEKPEAAWAVSDWLTCRGIYRVPIPEDIRAEITRARPAGTSKYWRLPFDKLLAIRQRIIPAFDVNKVQHYRTDKVDKTGYGPEIYPQYYDGSLNNIKPSTFSDGSYHKTATISQSELGFMACARNAPFEIQSRITGLRPNDLHKGSETCFVDGMQIGQHGKCAEYVTLAIEESDFLIIQSAEVKD